MIIEKYNTMEKFAIFKMSILVFIPTIIAIVSAIIETIKTKQIKYSWLVLFAWCIEILVWIICKNV